MSVLKTSNLQFLQKKQNGLNTSKAIADVRDGARFRRLNVHTWRATQYCEKYLIDSRAKRDGHSKQRSNSIPLIVEFDATPPAQNVPGLRQDRRPPTTSITARIGTDTRSVYQLLIFWLCSTATGSHTCQNMKFLVSFAHLCIRFIPSRETTGPDGDRILGKTFC
jgi:hypothetical protein